MVLLVRAATHQPANVAPYLFVSKCWHTVVIGHIVGVFDLQDRDHVCVDGVFLENIGHDGSQASIVDARHEEGYTGTEDLQIYPFDGAFLKIRRLEGFCGPSSVLHLALFLCAHIVFDQGTAGN